MESKSWIKNIWLYLVAVMAIGFLFSPAFGVFYFPLRDQLRGHPQAAHGTHPENFVGLWVRDEVVLNDTYGQAFYLMSDGRVAGTSSLTFRRWHFDANALYIDSWSGCGNSYCGVETTELSAEFDGPNSLRISSGSDSTAKGVGGTYRRVIVNETLKSELDLRQMSDDEKQQFKARMTLDAVRQFEDLSKAK